MEIVDYNGKVEFFEDKRTIWAQAVVIFLVRSANEKLDVVGIVVVFAQLILILTRKSLLFDTYYKQLCPAIEIPLKQEEAATTMILSANYPKISCSKHFCLTLVLCGIETLFNLLCCDKLLFFLRDKLTSLRR